MSAPEPIHPDLRPERATLEILWQQDVSATVLARGPDGSLSAGRAAARDPRRLRSRPSSARARRHGASGLDGADRARRRAAGRARARRARRARRSPSLELAARSVTEGPAPPAAPARRAHVARVLGCDDRRIGAGGARRDRGRAARRLRRRVRRRPRRARPRPLRLRRRSDRPRPPRRGRVRLGNRLMRNAPERARALPRRAHVGRARAATACRASVRSSGGSPTGSIEASSGARARRGSSAYGSTSDGTGEPTDGVRASSLELWLQAADDPTLALPTSLLHDGGDAVFGFLRSADPRIAVHRQLGLIEPVLAAGRARASTRSSRRRSSSTTTTCASSSATAIPRLEELGVPVLLPRNWVSVVQPAPRQPDRDERQRAVRAACSRPTRSRGSTGSSRSATRRSRTRSSSELAAAKEPLIRIAGRWHALRRSEVERALLFLERRREGSRRRSRPRRLGRRGRGGRARAGRGRARRRVSARLLAGGDERASSRSPRPRR